MNPGAPKALEKGCTCPSDINQRGEGTHNPAPSDSVLFLVSEDCPMHGKPRWDQSNTE